MPFANKKIAAMLRRRFARPRERSSKPRRTNKSREDACWGKVVPLTATEISGDAIIFTLGIYTTAEGNAKEHWRSKKRRADRQMAIVRDRVSRKFLPGPRDVRLTRLGPGKLDAHDNLPSAMKHIVDELAAIAGVDDGSPSWRWSYDQIKSPLYGVQITISREPAIAAELAAA